MTDPNARFVGSVPAAYDHFLGPLLFEPYADDMARRIRWSPGATLLEVAAGSGIVTSRLRAASPASVRITATDLSPEMLAIATQKYPGLDVTWQQADAQALPFPDASFDIVACQFGYMFFPDKPGALHEFRRVLKPGGQLWLSVWDALEHNPLAATGKATIAGYFTENPPTFYDVPFGFSDTAVLTALLEGASFKVEATEPVPFTGTSPTAREAAIGIVTGNPTIIAIQERATASADVIIDDVASRLAPRYGAAPIRIPMRAIMVSATAAG